MTTTSTQELVNVPDELKCYSPKVAKPIQHLADNEWLKPEDIACILMAGRINQYPSTLLGFCSVYLAAKYNGIQIADTIKMAYNLGRPFNLGWSANRIAQEHSRLSRLVTLKALAAENKTYNVDFIADQCASDFNGYWIKSSARLGMEGLCQGHCVASYGSGIEKQQYGIASVFLDGQRWTVQVFGAGAGYEKPRISQIQTKGGVRADMETRRAIHTMMNIDDRINPSVPTATISKAESHELLITQIYQACVNANIEYVQVEFYGGGDSGQFDLPVFSPEITNQELEEIKLTIRTLFNQHNGVAWEQGERVQEMSLPDAVTYASEQLADATGIDWFNNEGGSGFLHFDIIKAELRCCVNYMTETCGSDETFDMQTGETI